MIGYKDFYIRKNYDIVRDKDESKIRVTGIQVLEGSWEGKEYEFNKWYDVNFELYNNGNIKCEKKDNKIRLIDFNVPGIKFKELAKGYKK